MLLESFATLELEIANKGKTPTYSKGGKTSIVGLTLVNTRLMGEELDWRVSDRYTGSNRQALVYKLQLTSRTAGMDKLPIKERWAPSTFDREAFLCSLEGALLEGTAEEKAQSLSRAITAACDTSTSTRSNPRGRSLVYWWSEGIAAIRRECLRARRLHQRAARGPIYEELRVAYERKRRELKIAIKMAKRKCWRDLCEEADSDPWGRPYKAVMNKIKPRRPNAPTCPVFLDRVVRHLFLGHQERPAGTGLTVINGVAKSPGVTKAEVKMAAKKISIRKASGLVGIPGLAIKTGALNVPHIFVDTTLTKS